MPAPLAQSQLHVQVANVSHARRTEYLSLCPPDAAGALGSPGFVAPEIVNDGVHGPSMDMFSLGVVLFIMLVRKTAPKLSSRVRVATGSTR